MIQVRGLNNLMSRLSRISNIETIKIVEEVANDLEKAIQSKAKEFSNTNYMYIGKCDTRSYGTSSFIDVGFSTDKAPFELWSSLWFQQWGYFDKGWNFGENGPYVAIHQMWFTEAVKSAEGEIKKKLKARLKEEIQKQWEG